MGTQELLEIARWGAGEPAVNRSAACIAGVKILGLHSKNGRIYPLETLAQSTALYEGAKVNINHPRSSPGAPRDYQDRFGTLRDVRCEPERGLFGDLHYNPKHPLAEQLLWDAEHAPQQVGLSHHVQARTEQRDGATIVTEIVQVISVDLVADPATVNGLFEAASPAEPLTDELSTLRTALLHEQRRAADLERALLIRRRLSAVGLLGADDQPSELVDESLLAALHAAPDEATVGRLIARRCRLLEQARTWQAPAATRPQSREAGDRSGQTYDSAAAAREFAQALRR